MNNKVFTIQELQNLKFCELPNVIYNACLKDLRKIYGNLLDKLLPIFDKAKVNDMCQIVDIYQYITIL